jgi:hypothetical protein
MKNTEVNEGCSKCAVERNVYRVLVRKRDKKRPLA